MGKWRLLQRLAILAVLAVVGLGAGAGCLRQITSRFDHLSDQIDDTNKRMRLLNAQLEETKSLTNQIEEGTNVAQTKAARLTTGMEGLNTKAGELITLNREAAKFAGSMEDTDKKLGTIEGAIKRVTGALQK